MNNPDLLKWLTDRSELNIAAIEKTAGVYNHTLQKFKDGKRGLSKNSYEKLKPVLEKYGWKE